jgi:hypothetical protein
MGKGKTKFIKVFAKADCGCCEIEMAFTSAESVMRAFVRAGLSSSATIVDDKGAVHEGIDTFYGVATREGEAANRSLGYLMSKLHAG